MLADPEIDYRAPNARRPYRIPARPPVDPIERHGYKAAAESRLLGGVGTIVACALVAAGLLLTLNRFDRPKPATRPLVVMALPPAPAAKPRNKIVEPPRQAQKPVVVPRRERTPPPVIVPLPTPPVAAASPPRRLDPAPPAAVPAPSHIATAAPAAPAPASHGPDKWEGRVLARIERFRRYPADAERARIEGAAIVRFRIDRSGHILSSSLEHSSGSTELDEAALDTLRRADPLPRIPTDRPDEIELSVPIEFSVTR